MEWGVNDSLKSRAYGQKKEADSQTKQEKIESYASQGGHYYPVDAEGKFDEWGAMVKLMSAMHENDKKAQVQQKQIQKQQLGAILEQQRLEKLQQKQQEQTLKKHEYDLLHQKERALQQMSEQESSQVKSYQEYLKQQHQKHMQEHQHKKYIDRVSEREEEAHKLEKVQRDLLFDKERQQQQRQQLKQEMEKTLQYRGQIKNLERQDHENVRNEWKQLFQHNAEREVQRENNYKNFFRNYEEEMERRMNNHKEVVVTQQQDKQNKLSQIESKNEEEYKRQLLEQELQQKNWRKQNLLDTNFNNRKKIEDHWSQLAQDKELMKGFISERKKEEGEQRELEKMEKDQEREKQQVYKDTLDYQLRILDLQKHKYGTMTGEEKRMNRVDLHQFKSNQENNLQAMIPGIHNLNTVGTSPLRRGGRDIVNQFGRKSVSVTQDGLGEKRILSSSMKNIPAFENTMKKELAQKKEQQVPVDTYNPITNPIPWINQNPYINKEKTLAKHASHSNIFNY